MSGLLYETEFLLLKAKIRTEGDIQIIVSGSSMAPTIRDGAKIIVSAKKEYDLGDILVFSDVVGKKLTVHRLVMKHSDFFYCKGDNSFAIEKITLDDILGAVIFQNIDGAIKKLSKPTRQFLRHSLKVGLEFCKIGFDKEQIKSSKIYVDYREKYLLK